MLSYMIVGSGYRAEYFGRIAAAYPRLFRAMFLCRSAEKAELMRAHTGQAATVSPEECLAFRPDFAVIAVDYAHIADVALEWIGRGLPVVTETPVGNTEDKLRELWRLGREGARIVCCEQYHRQPLLAAGLRAVEQGLIGEPSSLYLSLVHDYHGASLMRRALRIAPGEGYTLRGVCQRSPVAETDSRYGAILDGRETEAARSMLHVSFDSGREAIYDFSPIQYRSYIRSRHLTLRASRGEWTDTMLLRLNGKNEPERVALLPEIPERYRILDTQALRDLRRNWTAELAPDTVQDEFAIASLLLDMEDYLAGGPSPYPLEEALEDAWFKLQGDRALAQPWQEVRCGKRPWLA